MPITDGIEDDARYRCESPVLLIIFNRLGPTTATLAGIRHARPRRLYIAADGPRHDVADDAERVAETRAAVLSGIDWECDVHTLMRGTNLGCRDAVTGAIDWFLAAEDAGIILEDDCCPSPTFFEFCDWGLAAFADDAKVATVSGSNLIEHLETIEGRNGFSSFMSPWGWATWRSSWDRYPRSLDNSDLAEVRRAMRQSAVLSRWQLAYWMTQFRHSFESDSIWDMRLQLAFFRDGSVSVYPRNNLVLNVGFGTGGTHTTGEVPGFVRRSVPGVRAAELMSAPPNHHIAVDVRRDDQLTATIWRCTPLGTLRFMVGRWARKVGIWRR